MNKTPPQPTGHITEQGQHIPVLLEQTLQYLAPQPGESYLDVTAGYGGHAKAVAERTGSQSTMTLIDRDQNAVTALQPFIDGGARLIHSDFLSAARELHAEGQRFDMVLADLGVSSPQFDVDARGFSFKRAAELDMRMDQREELSAATVVNEWPQEEIAKIIWRYGEEPLARRLAEAIVAHRPIAGTVELAEVIATIAKRKRIDATTRTFQAIRIAVNQELAMISGFMELIPDLLTPGGRVVIISFHSLEDRIVKKFFAEEAKAGYEAQLTILTKRPIDGATYDVSNPRARSAKLRAAAKIKNVV